MEFSCLTTGIFSQKKSREFLIAAITKSNWHNMQKLFFSQIYSNPTQLICTHYPFHPIAYSASTHPSLPSTAYPISILISHFPP